MAGELARRRWAIYGMQVTQYRFARDTRDVFCRDGTRPQQHHVRAANHSHGRLDAVGRGTAIEDQRRRIAEVRRHVCGECRAYMPQRFADGAAIGSATSRSSACAIGCDGTRSPTVSRPAVVRSATGQPACFDTTKVRPPGQKAAASLRSRSEKRPSRSAASTSATCTISGLNRGRSFAAKMPATASPRVASAPSPYTVSVGNATRRPARSASAARAIHSAVAGTMGIIENTLLFWRRLNGTATPPRRKAARAPGVCLVNGTLWNLGRCAPETPEPGVTDHDAAEPLRLPDECRPRAGRLRRRRRQGAHTGCRRQGDGIGPGGARQGRRIPEARGPFDQGEAHDRPRCRRRTGLRGRCAVDDAPAAAHLPDQRPRVTAFQLRAQRLVGQPSRASSARARPHAPGDDFNSSPIEIRWRPALQRCRVRIASRLAFASRMVPCHALAFGRAH